MSGFYLPSEEDYDTAAEDFVHLEFTKERNYQHFDLPLNDDDRRRFADLSAHQAPHRFLPLLGYVDITLSYRRDADGNKKVSEKPRAIRFASHEDAAYLQAYATELSTLYEERLRQKHLAEAVLAYRPQNGTNIDQAKSLFDEIKARQDCTVIAMDISGFFDCLNHGHLKSELLALLGGSHLDGHHGSVWKNVTRYSWVETSDLDVVLGKKRQRRGRVCTPRDYKLNVQGRKNGLIRLHDAPYGIPQGTPISGLYANIYMLSFDQEMTDFFNSVGGSYRRYSDDIAVVMPGKVDEDEIIAKVEKHLADYELAISGHKTDTASFKNGLLTGSKPIQYLGFTFDGVVTLIRASSLDSYRAKMNRGIHAKMVAAKAQGVRSNRVYAREALSRYTHVGKRRNFIKYAHRAADVHASSEIRAQVSDHMKWFKKAWRRERMKVFSDLTE